MITKRTFLKQSFQATLALGFFPQFLGAMQKSYRTLEFTLPALKYNYDALEPFISKQIMELHHSKHHAGYVKKLNEAIKGTPLEKLSIEKILAQISKSDTEVRNNGGGHYNHSLFWETLSPKNQQGKISEKLLRDITSSFGSMDLLKQKFSDIALNIFGSGWAWLIVNEQKKLILGSTPNQDNPLMSNISDLKGRPIMGLDVWEHAYYLQYQNKRKEYIDAFWNIVDWKAVSKKYEQAINQP